MSTDEKRTEFVHKAPRSGESVVPCCHRTPFDLPSTDRVTLYAQLVTCPAFGATSADLVEQIRWLRDKIERLAAGVGGQGE